MYFLAILENKFPRGRVKALAGHMYSLAIVLTHATNLSETLALTAADNGAETSFCAILYYCALIKNEYLPRQARDRHQKS